MDNFSRHRFVSHFSGHILCCIFASCRHEIHYIPAGSWQSSCPGFKLKQCREYQLRSGTCDNRAGQQFKRELSARYFHNGITEFIDLYVK